MTDYHASVYPWRKANIIVTILDNDMCGLCRIDRPPQGWHSCLTLVPENHDGPIRATGLCLTCTAEAIEMHTILSYHTSKEESE